MRAFLRGFCSLALAASLVLLTGCDSGGGGAADAVLAPSTSSLSFQADEGESETVSLTIVHKGVDSRPAPDEVANYAFTQTETTGSPADGSTSFDVTFTAPNEAGDYTVPARFRAGSSVVTVQLAGQALGAPILIDDFEDRSEPGYFSFSGDIGLSIEDNALRVDARNVGGPLVFPGIVTVFDGPVNFGATPIVAVRMKATPDTESVPRVRAALNQAGDAPDANATVPALLTDVPADGEYTTYYFDFRNNFVQFDGQPVNPANIGELVFLFNDNIERTFTGTLFIDRIERRSDIPE